MNSVKLSHEINANLIILFTDEIKFVKILSKFRPPCNVTCPTNCLKIKQIMKLIRGIKSFFYDEKNIINIEELIRIIIENYKQKNFIKNNIKIIVINAYIDKNKNKNFNNNDNKNILNNTYIRNGVYICDD
jgi:pyruvate kinase